MIIVINISVILKYNMLQYNILYLMEKRIQEVIEDIKRVSEDSKAVNNAKDLIHVLIAYLRTKSNKLEEDYVINAIVACMINETLPKVEEDTINLSLKELSILCNALIINEDEEEIKRSEPIDIIEDPIRETEIEDV